MSLANEIRREAALIRHVDKLPPNLLNAYVLELIKDAPPQEIDKLVVAFRAQEAVPAKD